MMRFNYLLADSLFRARSKGVIGAPICWVMSGFVNGSIRVGGHVYKVRPAGFSGWLVATQSRSLARGF